jgi:hypothetical protein
MLFVSLLKMKAGTPQEAIARRAQWQYPQGINVIGEYWPDSADAAVVTIFEAEDNGPIFALVADWGDIFEIDVHPAVTAEQGLQMAQQMMAG